MDEKTKNKISSPKNEATSFGKNKSNRRYKNAIITIVAVVGGTAVATATTLISINRFSTHKIHYSYVGIDEQWEKKHPFNVDQLPASIKHYDSLSLKAPNIDGYSFKEWKFTYKVTDSDGAEEDREIVPNKIDTNDEGDKYQFKWFDTGNKYPDIYVSAIYEINIYQVSLSLNEGTLTNLDDKDSYDGKTYDVKNGIATTSYTCLDEPFKFPSVARTGYDFASDGWFDEVRNQYYEGCDTSLVRDFNLVANWAIHPYNISYSFTGEGVDEFSNGIINNNPRYSNYEEEVVLTTPYLKGYDFAGWFDKDDKQVTKIDVHTFPANEQLDLEARFTPIEYSITYSDASNSNHSHLPTTYKRCSPNINIPAINPTGYNFRGWLSSNVSEFEYVDTIEHGSTGDIVFTADVELITYYITYNYDGLFEGTEITNNNPVAYDYETDVTLSNLTVPGYTFNGFFDNNGYKVTSFNKHTTTGNKTLTARFTPIEYSIDYSFRVNGTGAMQNATVKYYVYTTKFTLPEVVSTTRRFVGWQERTTKVVLLPGYQFGGGEMTNYKLDAVWAYYGEGTAEDPYQIYDAGQLAGITELDKYYILMNDITIASNSESVWTPVGTKAAPFMGNFNGNNKTINMVIAADSANNSDYVNYFGLFGYLGVTANVHDFNIAGSVGSSTDRLATNLFGFVAANNAGTVSNITCNVPTYLSTHSTGDVFVGGFVGKNASGIITNCVYGNAKIDMNATTAEKLYLGGVLGFGSGGEISDCSSSANLLGSARLCSYVGGLLGDRDLELSTRISLSSIPTSTYPIAGTSLSDVVDRDAEGSSVGMSCYDDKNVVGRAIKLGEHLGPSSTGLVAGRYYYIFGTNTDDSLFMAWIKYLGDNQWERDGEDKLVYINEINYN